MSRTRDLHKKWANSDGKPQPTSDVFRVFPARVVGTLLPEDDDIPEEFKHNYPGAWHDLFLALQVGSPHLDRLATILGMRKSSALEQLAEAGTPPPDFYMKEGIDGETAYYHLIACMQSYEPKQEHKVAGCRYLMDLWFEKVVWDGRVFTRMGMEKEDDGNDSGSEVDHSADS
jgi:hypothetical protein